MPDGRLTDVCMKNIRHLVKESDIVVSMYSEQNAKYSGDGSLWVGQYFLLFITHNLVWLLFVHVL